MDWLSSLGAFLIGATLPIVGVFYGFILCIIFPFIAIYSPIILIISGKIIGGLIIGIGVIIYWWLNVITKGSIGRRFEKTISSISEKVYSAKGLFAFWVLGDICILAQYKISSNQLPYLILGCFIGHAALWYFWRYVSSEDDKVIPTSPPSVTNTAHDLPPRSTTRRNRPFISKNTLSNIMNKMSPSKPKQAKESKTHLPWTKDTVVENELLQQDFEQNEPVPLATHVKPNIKDTRLHRVKRKVSLIRTIEMEAMKAVINYEKARGQKVKNVSNIYCGYDLESTGPEGFKAIEVKGKGRSGDIILTANEWRIAKDLKKDYYLYIVEHIFSKEHKSNPKIKIFQDPYSYFPNILENNHMLCVSTQALKAQSESFPVNMPE